MIDGTSVATGAVAVIGVMGTAFGAYRAVLAFKPEKNGNGHSRRDSAIQARVDRIERDLAERREDCIRIESNRAEERRELWGAVNDLREGLGKANASLARIEGALNIGGRN